MRLETKKYLPAVAEQRNGRVHRIGGIRSRGSKKKTIVHYCYQTGSYSEHIKKRVEARRRVPFIAIDT